jgi:hypothetical protein
LVRQHDNQIQALSSAPIRPEKSLFFTAFNIFIELVRQHDDQMSL